MSYPRGRGRRLGSIHGHEDPAGSFAGHGFLRKRMLVDSLALTESALADSNHHPPNKPGDFISTIILEPWEPVHAIRWLNDSTRNRRADVELEQVIAVVSGAGELVWLPPQQRISFTPDGLEPHIHLVPHKESEFHMRVNVPKNNIGFPDPARLLAETALAGMSMRSWYRFDRPDGTWGYNSNEFADFGGAEELVLHNHKLMLRYLRGQGFNYGLYTFLESVLVICHSDAR